MQAAVLICGAPAFLHRLHLLGFFGFHPVISPFPQMCPPAQAGLGGFKHRCTLQAGCCMYRNSARPHVWGAQMCLHMRES